MAGRSRTSFQKRQKEIARAEKQRDKLAKRQQRKDEAHQQSDDTSDREVVSTEEGIPAEGL